MILCEAHKSHSVRDLCDYTFSSLGLNYQDYLGVDKKYYRPEELKHLKGDSSRLKSIGFESEYTFETMLDEMIEHWENVYK